LKISYGYLAYTGAGTGALAHFIEWVIQNSNKIDDQKKGIYSSELAKYSEDYNREELLKLTEKLGGQSSFEEYVKRTLGGPTEKEIEESIKHIDNLKKERDSLARQLS
jgi:hypothetical protein